MTVFNLKKNTKAKVVAVDIVGAPQYRLFSLGITVGAIVQVLSFSLFKSAVLLSCGAVRVSMRKDYAQKIVVEEI